MEDEDFIIVFETMEEIQKTLNKLREEPLLVTESEIDQLDYNFGIIASYAKQLKRRDKWGFSLD